MSPDQDPKWEVVFYQTVAGERPAEEWLKSIPIKMQAKIARILDLLEEHGTFATGPYIQHEHGKLWKVRVEQAKVQYRLFYFPATGQKFVVLHGFVKKSQKTPPKEIEVAEQRLKDYLERSERAKK